MTRREEVLNFFKTALRIAYRPKEVSDALNIPAGTVRRELRHLANDKKIQYSKEHHSYSQEAIKYKRHYLAVAVYCDKVKSKYHAFTRESKKDDKPGGKKQAHNIAIWTYASQYFKEDLDTWLAKILLDWLKDNGFGNCWLGDANEVIDSVNFKDLTFGYSKSRKNFAVQDVPANEIYKKYKIDTF